MAAAKKQQLEIEGRQVPVSNLDKVLYPAAHFTKGQVIDYYVQVAPYILPHLHNRPLTMKRFPDGVRGEAFYEKDAPKFTPAWVETTPVPRKYGGTDIRYILANDLPTLVWLANLASLELHPFLHLASDLQRPTSVVFDLDPGEGMGVLDCARVAFLMRDMLRDLGLESFPKVSGSKGIQMYVPLNTDTDYGATRAFAHAIAQLMEQREPKLVVSEMPKHLRIGKIFIDWSQNSDFKTTVGVYSMRAKADRPFISLPVDWDELDAALKTKDKDRLYWSPKDALARLAERGDLFAPVLKLKQKLPGATEPASLETYNKKRDFTKTAEPPPRVPKRSHQGSRRRFVIQKHAASHLHYDFRLEMHDVLKSWAVPKGVPLKLDERRLAMPTEDHPMDYLEFEGVIPKGQYGGGTVMVWDIGTYELIEGNYFKGYLKFYLDGAKLKGEWTLSRKREKDQERDVWFLAKSEKPMRALSIKRENTSAVSGKTMEQIAADPEATWHSNRDQPDLSKLPKAKLEFVEPMLAKPSSTLPDEAGWSYEIKLDGYRALAIREAKRTQLLSRRGNDLEDRFPALIAPLKALPAGTIVDGEVVALDAKGRPAFNILQHARGSDVPVFYYLFDLLAYQNKDVRKLPFTERRELLEQHVMPSLHDPIRLSNRFDAKPADMLAAAREQGLEGVIGKRTDSLYEASERSGAWLKCKTNQGQELVIGGYMPGPHAFDSLLVGYYKKPGELIFIAKIRNGFTPALRREVATHFEGLETNVCPFANLPERKSARRGEALTAEVMKKCRWLKPELVAQIEYTDWTDADHLRHSRFAGLRDDKPASEVVREVTSQSK